MCMERISMCRICGYRRHITWIRCNAHIYELVSAVNTLSDPPHPSECPFVGPAEVAFPLNKDNCPTDNEGCGGRRKEERERKDSGVAGVDEDESDVTSVRSSEGQDSTWEDCAVTDGSPQEESEKPITRWWQVWAARWASLYPKIKYAPGYTSVGDKDMKPNYNNMGYSYAVHLGPTHRPPEVPWGVDIVRPITTRFPAQPGTSVIEEVDLRESMEPDETYLLLKGWDKIPELRAQWAEKKRRNPQPERPVVTVADAVEKIFGRPQHVRE